MSRTYQSERRAAQARRTRSEVVTAAARLFRAHGYAGTTIRAVAAQAGVAVPTVEAMFGAKARLLKAAIDVAIAGDHEPLPVLDRPDADRVASAASAADALTVVAQIVTPAQDRSAGLVLAAFEGAPFDADLAAVADELAAQRQATAGWIVDVVSARAPLRISREESVASLWILMDPAVFERVTRRLGWTLDRYQAWFADAALHLLCPDPL